MIVLLASVLSASLLGSLHCAAMCGVFVSCAGPGSADATRRTLLGAQSAYHLGRLASYILVGGSAGAVGSALDRAGAWVGLQQLAMVVAALLLIATGVVTLATRWSRFRNFVGRPKLPATIYGWIMRRAKRVPVGQRSLALGVGSAFLPCGWLYSFALVAGGTGDLLQGSAVMAAFWVGTVPALALVGFGARFASPWLRAHAPTAAALLILVAGFYALAVRVPLLMGEGSHAHGSLPAAEGALEAGVPSSPTCH